MRRKLTGVLCAVAMVLAATLLTTASPAAADEPSQTGPYLIGDPAGERFAFVGIFFLDNRVWMRPPLEPNHLYYLGQQWYVRDAGSGKVNIVNAKEPFSNAALCMVPSSTTGATHYVRGGICLGAPGEVWTIEPVTGGVRSSRTPLAPASPCRLRMETITCG